MEFAARRADSPPTSMSTPAPPPERRSLHDADPMLLVGDLNFTPGSYSSRLMAGEVIPPVELLVRSEPLDRVLV